MKSRLLVSLLTLGLLALAAGCQTAVKPDSVVVSIASLKVVGSASAEPRVTVTFRFTSESLNPLGFSSSAHKLYLNGAYIGRATTSTAFGLPSLATTTEEVPLVLENAAALKQLVASQDQPTAKYRLESVLFAKRGDEETRLKDVFEDTVDLSGLKALAR